MVNRSWHVSCRRARRLQVGGQRAALAELNRGIRDIARDEQVMLVDLADDFDSI